MLTYFSKILITLGTVGILTGCSSETPEDEKYGLIEGNFPLLVDVPGRPTPPSQKFIDEKINDLEQDRLDAETRANKNLTMIKK